MRLGQSRPRRAISIEQSPATRCCAGVFYTLEVASSPRVLLSAFLNARRLQTLQARPLPGQPAASVPEAARDVRRCSLVSPPGLVACCCSVAAVVAHVNLWFRRPQEGVVPLGFFPLRFFTSLDCIRVTARTHIYKLRTKLCSARPDPLEPPTERLECNALLHPQAGT